MQHSTLTRIIIIFFMIVHITQAYTLTVNLKLDAACHVYVTDCHGKTLRDAGVKNCNPNDWHWPDAPETYCLHIRPKGIKTKDKYCVGSKDGCFSVEGNLTEGWNIITCGTPSVPAYACEA